MSGLSLEGPPEAPATGRSFVSMAEVFQSATTDDLDEVPVRYEDVLVGATWSLVAPLDRVFPPWSSWNARVTSRGAVLEECAPMAQLSC